MIQRIQTIYLLVAASFMFLFYFFPIAVFTTDTFAFEFFNCHITHPENLQPPITLVPLAILPFFSLLTSLFTIFMFKNRKLQIRLGKINLLFSVLTILIAIVYFFKINEMLAGTVRYGYSAIFPVLTIVMILMANKAIKQDEKLVRAADRIR